MGKRKNKVYSAEFKISVIMDMHKHRLGYRDTVRKFWEDVEGKEPNYIKQLQRRERYIIFRRRSRRFYEIKTRQTLFRQRNKKRTATQI